MKIPTFTAEDSIATVKNHHNDLLIPFTKNIIKPQFGCHYMCCPSGDCDTTCCACGTARVECDPITGKANAICNNDCCFLTTACINSKGLPDDCAELTILRNFRDSFLIKTNEGKSLVKQYYKIAPKICNAISNDFNSTKIYDELYSELVLKTIKKIEQKEFDMALKNYKNITFILKNRFFK